MSGCKINRHPIGVILFIILAWVIPVFYIVVYTPKDCGNDVFRPMIEIKSKECVQLESLSTGIYWKITFDIINHDSEPVEIQRMYIDDVPVSAYNRHIPVDGVAVTGMINGYFINDGYSRNVALYIDGDYSNFTSGKVILIRLFSYLVEDGWGDHQIILVKLSQNIDLIQNSDEWRSNH